MELTSVRKRIGDDDVTILKSRPYHGRIAFGQRLGCLSVVRELYGVQRNRALWQLHGNQSTQAIVGNTTSCNHRRNELAVDSSLRPPGTRSRRGHVNISAKCLTQPIPERLA